MSRAMQRCGCLMMVVLALGTVSCGRGDRHDATPGAPEQALTGGVADESIYDLDLPLVDANGQALKLADLRGQTLVAAMMYSSCNSVCPRVTEDMKTIERQLSARDRDGVTFALFSLDPGRDTPEALRRFGAEHGLDASPWRLFAASEDGVRDLAAVLGVKYKRETNGDIAHTAMIFVIDRTGTVRHRQVGLKDNQRELIDALVRARS